MTNFFCVDCGETFSKWFGKCSACGEFGTVREFTESKISSKKKSRSGSDLMIKNTEKSQKNLKKQRISTKIDEVDRVLGGGFFPGSITLFGGNPGIGKSTLALQIFQNCDNSMYFSGEESIEQVQSRSNRISRDKNHDDNGIFSTNSLEDIVATIEKHLPALAVIDSIQMIGTDSATFGSISQIRENAEILVRVAKSTETAILVIGHVTKNDELAGPRLLEHLVDVVLCLDGDRNSEIRVLRSAKNRFGSTLEIGVFEMREFGLTELKNPSEFFLAERAENATGSAISVVREGARNFLLEIQVLTVKTNFGQPRRTATGFSLAKFHLLSAVISKFTPFSMENFDGYGSVVGGFRISEPAADLAIGAAILSSRAEKEIPPNTVIFGEVGLSGEVRSVSNFESRVREAEKLGFKKIICPRLPKKFKFLGKIEICPIKNIGEFVREAWK